LTQEKRSQVREIQQAKDERRREEPREKKKEREEKLEGFSRPKTKS
jgi:hypothetical protein